MPVAYNPETMQFETQAPILVDRQELIEQCKELVSKLKEYSLSNPRVKYLTASYLQLDSSGIYVSRRNINKDKIPVSKIKELLADGERRLKEAEDKFNALLQKFPEDVTEICFSSDEPISKVDIARNLAEKKRKDLAKICTDRIPLHNQIGSFSLSLDRFDSKIPIRIGFDKSEGFEFHAYGNTNVFLDEYQEIKAKLEQILDYTFKPKEESNDGK